MNQKRPTEGSVSIREVSRGQERTDYLSPRKVNAVLLHNVASHNVNVT
jgi:hypothetical protein